MTLAAVLLEPAATWWFSDALVVSCAFVFCVALAASLVLTPIMGRVASHFGVVDDPGLRKVHHASVPYLGGVAIFAALLIGAGAGLWRSSVPEVHIGRIDPAMWGLLGGAVVIFALGLVDDVRHLRARYKLLAQIVVATAVWICGVRVDVVSVGSLSLDLGSFSLPCTVLWIVGVTNALNLIDGIDGLAGGIGAIAAAALAILGITSGDLVSAGLLVALVGALLGFLVYNFHPARIFMGDCGSLTLGYLLATCSVASSGKSATFLSMLVPIAALGVPIFDTAFSMLRRVLERRSVFSPDRNHIHHRMLDLGYGQRRVVLLLYAETALACTIGLGAVRGQPWMMAIAFAAIIGVHVFVFRAVGSVRLRESVRAFRRTREVLRQAASEKDEYESLHLQLREATTIDAWWDVMRQAAQRLRFASVEVLVACEDQAPRVLSWKGGGSGRHLGFELPVAVDSLACELLVRAQIDIDTLESAGRRMSLFGRLLDDHEAKAILSMATGETRHNDSALARANTA